MIMPLLVSIILGFLCFVFIANLYQVRIPRAPEIEKRLENISYVANYWNYFNCCN